MLAKRCGLGSAANWLLIFCTVESCVANKLGASLFKPGGLPDTIRLATAGKDSNLSP